MVSLSTWIRDVQMHTLTQVTVYMKHISPYNCATVCVEELEFSLSKCYIHSIVFVWLEWKRVPIVPWLLCITMNLSLIINWIEKALSICELFLAWNKQSYLTCKIWYNFINYSCQFISEYVTVVSHLICFDIPFSLLFRIKWFSNF